MRRVERSEPAPEALLEKGQVELAEATTYFGPPRQAKEAFDFKVYKHDEVKRALERMFHGKCAYCEIFYASGQPMDVEHFRPKGAVVEDKAHEGYWWLGMSWDNLLPSCIDCNRKRNQPTPTGDTSQVRLLENTLEFDRSRTIGSGKKDSFPMAATGVRAAKPEDVLSGEKALLLNPCSDEPEKHLEFFFDRNRPVSFVLPRKLISSDDTDYAGADGLSIKGATSIHVYGLNRLRLVQARTELLRRLEFLGGLAIDLKALVEELENANASNTASASLKLIEKSRSALTGLSDRVLAEIRRMGDPRMPHSAMAQAWTATFIKRLG